MELLISDMLGCFVLFAVTVIEWRVERGAVFWSALSAEEQKQMKRVLKTIMAAADEGNSSAQYSLWVMYAEEIGVPLKNFCGFEKQQIRDSLLLKSTWDSCMKKAEL
jgi:hypothetical protein